MMSHKEFHGLQSGDRIAVVRMAIAGRKPCIDEETGEMTTRPVMRKVGSDIGMITRRIDNEMVAVRFDAPVPNVNDGKLSINYSVYFRDVIGRQ